jgi:hypothetical protein
MEQTYHQYSDEFIWRWVVAWALVARHGHPKVSKKTVREIYPELLSASPEKLVRILKIDDPTFGQRVSTILHENEPV